MFLNVSKVAAAMAKRHGGNTYTYRRVKSLLNGVQCNVKKKEIQWLRRLIREDLTQIDNQLSQLEKDAKP